MTRINTVDPCILSDKHLVAEYRELPRVFGLAKAAFYRGEIPADARNPREYCLGSGHARFFYDKLTFLTYRFDSIVRVMRARGFKPTHFYVPDGPGSIIWYGDWTPTDRDHIVNLRRLVERAPQHSAYSAVLAILEARNNG